MCGRQEEKTYRHSNLPSLTQESRLSNRIQSFGRRYPNLLSGSYRPRLPRDSRDGMSHRLGGSVGSQSRDGGDDRGDRVDAEVGGRWDE